MVAMIPVAAQPEPPTFDAMVRRKGLAHLAKKGFSPNQPLPPKADITPYWRACLPDLHQAYGGVCAYLGIFLERVVGGGSVDHFIAKSTHAGLAYEWSNYRLACSRMNSRKREYSDVLDPFSMAPDLFFLELASGRIYPNPDLDAPQMRRVKKTIKRLDLDDPLCRDLRTRWYQDYLEHSLPAVYLKEKSPFVWYEADRQGLL
ncbi:hypothetical protein D8B24_06615 [Verminephrobacter aporrectodeae subsp. tuberculatae]|uniref:hypothetical protein n=1 Tax=Verminephrobacter aporrectodeae TaxID=1110389 RepID=UPI002242F86B|nr:hypothetical protein [Verminephrobacter aporrectodeae]MCW8206724.1 hypothetical protein [Verminephrobacter aporrectodeae subsp. tuberculatae]